MDVAHCIECDDEVGKLSGWETTSGKVMCGACFITIHGPRAAQPLGARRRPAARPAPSRRLFWLTNAQGEEIETNAFRIVGDGRTS